MKEKVVRNRQVQKRNRNRVKSLALREKRRAEK
jgi:hypothetical protein